MAIYATFALRAVLVFRALRTVTTHTTVATLAFRAIAIVFAFAGDTDIVCAALPFRAAHAGTADDVGLTAHCTFITDAANLPHLATDALPIVAAVLRLGAAGLRLTDADLVDSAALPGMLTADL